VEASFASFLSLGGARPGCSRSGDRIPSSSSSSARGRGSLDAAGGRPKLPRGSNSRHSFDIASAFGDASSRLRNLKVSGSGARSEGRPPRTAAVAGSVPGAVVASSAARRPDAGLAAERRALSAASLSPVLGLAGVARGWLFGDSFSFEIPPAGEMPPCDAPPPPPPDDDDARFCLKRSSDDAGRRVPSSPTMPARSPHRVVGTSNGRVDFLGPSFCSLG